MPRTTQEKATSATHPLNLLTFTMMMIFKFMTHALVVIRIPTSFVANSFQVKRELHSCLSGVKCSKNNGGFCVHRENENTRKHGQYLTKIEDHTFAVMMSLVNLIVIS